MDPRAIFATPGRKIVAGVPEGHDAFVLAEFARSWSVGDILHVASDEVRLARLVEALAFFAPDLEVLEFPPWDTSPYDRASPNAEIMSRRVDVLSRLADAMPSARGKGRIVVTTVAALLQRVPRREAFAGVGLDVAVGGRLDLKVLAAFLDRNGYARTEQVMEPGEYAIRGGIVDVYPPGTVEPLRLDLFGDEVEEIRTFDAVSQRTTGKRDSFALRPTSEIFLDAKSIARFRTQYREMFGASGAADPLYESISAGRRFAGLEHWLPLFHTGMDTLFAYVPDAVVTLDDRVGEAREARLDLIMEYYEARSAITAKGMGSGFAEGGVIYNPVPPHSMFLAPPELDRLLAARPVAQFSSFAPVDTAENIVDAEGRPGRDFADVRAHPDRNIYEAVRDHLITLSGTNLRVAITGFTVGSRDRLASLLHEHGVTSLKTVDTWAEAVALPTKTVAVMPFGLERGFATPGLAIFSEQDILGERLARPASTKRRLADKFIADISALTEGDRVVHVDHGIGQYDGLSVLQVGGAPHDCLRILYDGGDKLFVPVENIDVLSRYGSGQEGVSLDKLGGVAWQTRKAKLKNRIADMAARLIEVAAARKIRQADILTPPEGLFDEFCARFPYAETEDQLRAIGEVIVDIGSGRPMDRLICGDVGFGKTEVALRAAFVAVMSGAQVAIVVPTTLLARQHYRTFSARFAGLPVRVEQLSRLVTAKQATAVKKGLADGTTDIVIGTHALLSKSMTIHRLGLLIVDEEQHFGVAHKERLKQIRADIHVLTLTATPIPRTLQMALAGVREMSIIATPPVDRLAVRTFVLPYDPVVVREALLRERFRGGQSFYVCPRIEDIDPLVSRIRQLIPDLRIAVAHGRMSPSELEEVMTAFTDQAHDVLVCTNIIESGLDMPLVNTIIMHRADMFGLSQLYQLRGRVGRGKARSYAYLTVKPNKPLTKTASKRLYVMQTLDALGAGFTLASHDMDIRGAGNLLGDEQSGHIREVGIELYQHLLEEAVAAHTEGGGAAAVPDEWSPLISIGTAVMIPEAYVKDLGTRLSLYRRIASMADREDIDSLAVELVDRFGTMPKEVENLLEIVALKILCRQAGVDRLDAGPKGGVIGFRNNRFANPAGLIALISQQGGTIKVRPDHRLVIMRNWEGPVTRVQGVRGIMTALVKLAAKGK